MLNPKWLLADGGIDYEKYLDSKEFRKFRRAYFGRHPDAVCFYCSMTLAEHRERFSKRLVLVHTTYQTLGFESDEDLELMCLGCYDFFSGAGEILDMDQALRKVRWWRAHYTKAYERDNETLWRHLARMARCEEFAIACKRLDEQEAA